MQTEKAASATLSKLQGLSSKNWQLVWTEKASAKFKLTPFSYIQDQSV